MIEYQSKSQEELPGTKPSIAVVGIGGAGANVLDRIALEGLADHRGLRCGRKGKARLDQLRFGRHRQFDAS